MSLWVVGHLAVDVLVRVRPRVRAGCGRAYVPMTVLAHVPARVPAVPMQVKDLSLMELGATLALAAAL